MLLLVAPFPVFERQCQFVIQRWLSGQEKNDDPDPDYGRRTHLLGADKQVSLCF